MFADINGLDVALTHGDTILVLSDPNTVHKVRLTGIDAPERGGRLAARRGVTRRL